MPPPARTISDQLRDAINDSGLSVRALGKLADVDDGMIHRFLSGERGLTTPTLDKLCRALGLRLTESGRRASPARRPAPARGDRAKASALDS